ncbi:MAG: DUF927 domain-containing protein [Candidatus Ozemobacteraceae bacterium]
MNISKKCEDEAVSNGVQPILPYFSTGSTVQVAPQHIVSEDNTPITSPVPNSATVTPAEVRPGPAPVQPKEIIKEAVSKYYRNSNMSSMKKWELFWSVLYPLDTPGQIAVLSGKAVTFFLPAEAWKITQHAEKCHKVNIYFGVGTRDIDVVRRNNPKGTGKSDSVIYIPGFWADIDIGTAGHSAEGYAPTNEIAAEVLREIGIPPTIIVDTGGGLHVYFKLIDGITITCEEERRSAQQYLKRFHAYIASVFAKFGFKIDDVSDLPRILRVPGSFNHKRGVPELVEILYINPDNMASLHDWDGYLPAIEDIPDLPSSSRSRTDLETLMVMICQCDFVQYCYENTEKLPENLWYPLLSNVSTIRPGGIDLCHVLSREHPDYSKSATDAKILHAMGYPPHTCDHIRAQGFVCSKQCKSRAPAARWTRIGMTSQFGSFDSANVINISDSGSSPTVQNETIEIAEIISTDAPVAEAHTPFTCGTTNYPAKPGTNAHTAKPCVSAEQIDELIQQVVADKGAVFKPENLALLLALQDTNQGDFTKVKDKLQGLKVPIRDLNKGLKDARQLTLGRNTPARSLNVDFLKIPLVIPDGYCVVDAGVYQQKSKGDMAIVCYYPLIVSGRVTSLDQGLVMLRVSYYISGRWNHVTKSRADFMSGRSIIELAGQGFPVSSASAALIVQYLEAFEAANHDRLPQLSATSGLGWIGDNGELGFMAGSNRITPDGLVVPADPKVMKAGDWRKTDVILVHDNAGLTQVVDAMQIHGDFDSWKEVLIKVRALPLVNLAFIMAFVPVVQMLFPGVENFIFHLYNGTSCGKTTSLYLAASVWGNPKRLFLTWNTTAVHIERVCSACSYLPVFIDEVKLVEKPELIRKLIFSIASGVGKGRGAIHGSQATSRWTLSVFSTGEVPITSFTPDAGTRARCLEARGAPFSSLDPELAASFIEELKAITFEHYGHAGPLFVSWIVKNRERWQEFRQRFSEKKKTNRAGIRSGAEARLLDHVSIIEMTAELLQEALGIEIDLVPVTRKLKELVEEAVADVPVEVRALRAIGSWALGNQHRFENRVTRQGPDAYPPTNGYVGAWPNGPDWDSIAFQTRAFEERLKEDGFENKQVLTALRDRKWIEVSECGRFTTQVMVNGERAHMVKILRKAFIAVGVIDPTPTPEEQLRSMFPLE